MIERRGAWLCVLAASVGLLSARTLEAQAEPDALRPGDAIRLRIHQEPTLSGEFLVDRQGRVSLPRLGDVPLADWPADSIRPRLTRLYGSTLREPVVDVTLLRRITVTGAVQRPGVYSVDPTMRLADALALAGGAAPDGRRSRVELRRDSTRMVIDLDHVNSASEFALRSGDRLFVPQRNWLDRNTWLIGSIVGAVATLLAVRMQ